MKKERMRELAGLQESMSDAEFEQLKQDIRLAQKKLDELQKKYKRQTGREFKPFQ